MNDRNELEWLLQTLVDKVGWDVDVARILEADRKAIIKSSANEIREEIVRINKRNGR